MAVSKTQNERPAINALIDLANALETTTQGQTAQISNLQGALTSEISSRTNADTLLGNRILAEETARANADNALEHAIDAEETARDNAISDIMSLIGDTFNQYYTVSNFADETDDAIQDLNDFKALINRTMRFGLANTAPITVAGNNSYDGSVSYGQPYSELSISFAIPAFTSYVDQTDLEVKVTECSYSGFDYTVVNKGATSANFILGYMALGFSL